MSRESPKSETELLARVEQIRRFASDDEAAHSEEDELHQQVLALIADGGCPNPQRWAELVLKTREMDFARWCA